MDYKSPILRFAPYFPTVTLWRNKKSFRWPLKSKTWPLNSRVYSSGTQRGCVWEHKAKLNGA